MKLPLIPQDKANHFIYGFFIYIIACLFVSNPIAFGIVCLFALGKEIKDQVVYGEFDIFDMISTILPAIILL
jgi:protein-S-isoprenylcysteine O-methyltransferase Ste14